MPYEAPGQFSPAQAIGYCLREVVGLSEVDHVAKRGRLVERTAGIAIISAERTGAAGGLCIERERDGLYRRVMKRPLIWHRRNQLKT